MLFLGRTSCSVVFSHLCSHDNVSCSHLHPLYPVWFVVIIVCVPIVTIIITSAYATLMSLFPYYFNTPTPQTVNATPLGSGQRPLPQMGMNSFSGRMVRLSGFTDILADWFCFILWIFLCFFFYSPFCSFFWHSTCDLSSSFPQPLLPLSNSLSLYIYPWILTCVITTTTTRIPSSMIWAYGLSSHDLLDHHELYLADQKWIKGGPGCLSLEEFLQKNGPICMSSCTISTQ